MKRVVTIFFLLVGWLPEEAQVVFRTNVPRQPVVEGEAFQLQYVLESTSRTAVIKPVSIPGFRVISGPNIYTGALPAINGEKWVQNFVYTIEATRKGKWLIPGAAVLIEGKLIRSNEVMIDVISASDAARLFNRNSAEINSDYFLRPGEDAYARVRRNLFLRILVDKTSCFVGEAVTATFKLYSRLQSKSDIVKNPGFYGFAVYDMVNLADRERGVETVNGKPFDVHTVRKVQLYPLQPGEFTIDAMEVKNRVEFSRSRVIKKTEQEIREGVLGNDEEPSSSGNTEIVETEMHSAPVTIHVRPLTEKNRPADFTGAVGHFTISTRLLREQIARNEDGTLELSINGKGNFLQIVPPAVQWPAGIEGFEPVLRDSLDKTTSPLSGQRIFRYGFVSATQGEYSIPPIIFSFFNPDSGTYTTLQTTGRHLTISNEEKKRETLLEEVKTRKGNRSWMGWLLLWIILFMGTGWLVLGSRKEKRNEMPLPLHGVPGQSAIDELLKPASRIIKGGDKEFYTSLHGAIWEFFRSRFAVSGSSLSKEKLQALLKKRGFREEITRGMDQLLQQCEMGIFTKASLSGDKEKLLQAARELLREIEAGGHSEYL